MPRSVNIINGSLGQSLPNGVNWVDPTPYVVHCGLDPGLSDPSNHGRLFAGEEPIKGSYLLSWSDVYMNGGRKILHDPRVIIEGRCHGNACVGGPPALLLQGTGGDERGGKCNQSLSRCQAG